MAVIAFDTLKHVERLTAAGMPDTQARAEASALRDVLAEYLETTIATKQDIQDVKNELKKEIQDVKGALQKEIQDVKIDITRMELRLTIRLSAVMAAMLSIAVAIMKLH